MVNFYAHCCKNQIDRGIYHILREKVKRLMTIQFNEISKL
ncbi:hypothetical protein Xekj_00443 [Xenorhabdus sp. KJ12.1]|nr:hypothetical protein Xekj_00443 [Xenorhabdus sp. KJ12.1]